MKYPNVIVILFLFVLVNLQSQSSINPSNAVPICGHGFYDIGLPKSNFTDIADFNCFPQDAIFDHYELLLIQGITKGGTININFMPSGDEDVDFIVYQVDGRNLSPLRCMASGKTFGQNTSSCLGVTGLSEGSEDLVEFEGCDGGNDNFVKNLDAEIGDKFLILVTNYKSGNAVPMEMYGTAEFDIPRITIEDSLQFCKDFNFTFKLPDNKKLYYNWEVSENAGDQFQTLGAAFGNRFVLPTNLIGEKYYQVKVGLVGSNCKESTSNISFVKTIDCPQCNDGIQNGTETDIDCGGKECPSCTGCEMITSIVLNDTIVNCEGNWTDTVEMIANYCNVIYPGTFSMEVKGNDCLKEIIKTWTFELPDSIAIVKQVITVDKKPEIINLNLAKDIHVQCDYNIPAVPQLFYLNKCNKDTIYPIFSQRIETGNNLPPRLMRKWVFSSPCGDSLLVNQSILIQYTQGIKIPTAPVNLELSCEIQTPAPPSLQVILDCSTQIAARFREEVGGDACRQIINRYYSFTLPSGRDTTISYSIVKIDTVAPIPNLNPQNAKFLCLSDTSARPEIFALDNCTAGKINPIYTVTDNGGLGTEDSPLVFKRNWLFKDECGNSNEVNQEIVVQNSTEILLPVGPKDTLVSCLSEIPDTTDLVAAAGCGVAIKGMFSEQRIGNPCDMTIVRTWDFAYLDLQPKSLVQTIKVLNQTKPAFSVPNDSTISCGTTIDPETLGKPSNVIVGCNIGNNITYKDVFSENSSCPGSGLITRSWTVKDQCNNETTLKQYITTIDTTAPQLIVPIDNVLIACKADIPEVEEIFALDACTGEKIKGIFSESDNGGEAIPSSHLIITRKWIFKDRCGNEKTSTQLITVTGSTEVTYPDAPEAYTVSCMGEVGSMENLVATNGCENRAEGVKNETRTGDSCQMQIIRTWTFNFPDIPTKTISQTVTISNKKLPDFKVPANLTISCEEERSLELLGDVFEITTYCNIGTSSSYVDGPLNEICKGTGTWDRIWKVTDVCGNSTTKIQTINIEDKVAPIPPTPEADLVFDCREDISNPLELIASDNCTDGDIKGIYSSSFNDGLGTNTSPLVINRKWTFTDACGNVSETSQIVTISDASEIQLPASPENLNIHCLADLPTEDFLIASDRCNDSIVGIFKEERIGDECGMTIIRTWTFSSFDKDEKTIKQEITLTNDIEPQFTVPGEVELACGLYDENIYYGEASQIVTNCNNGFEVSYQDGLLNKICGNAGTITRQWKVRDQCGNETIKNQTINVIDTVGPVAQNIPENQILSCLSELVLPQSQIAIDDCSGATFAANPIFTDNGGLGIASNPFIRTINWSFTDACGNQTISTQIVSVNGTNDNFYEEAPAGLTVLCKEDILDRASLTGNNFCGKEAEVFFNQEETGDLCYKTITRTWTFKLPDQEDHVETQVIILENNYIPQFNLPDNVSISCESYDGNTEFGTISNIITGCNADYNVSFIDNGDFNATCKDGVEIQRSWTLTDVCGNTFTDFQTITLEDKQAPEAPDAESNLTFTCYDDITEPADLYATDNCEASQIRGVLNTFDDENYGTVLSPRNILRTWTFTDACGNASTANQLLTVSDDSEISLPSGPENYNINCIDDLLDPVILIASDACNINIVGELEENQVGDDCNKIITRTWTFENLDKSPKTIVQIIILDNNQLPEFTVPSGLSLECGEYDENASYGLPQNLQVNCRNTYEINYLDQITNFGCGGTKTISRMWKVTDNCGNESAKEQVIEIIDTQAPVPQNIPEDEIFECMSDLTDPQNQVAIDDCTGDVIVSFPAVSSNFGSGNSGDPFVETRTWTFRDACGNISEAVQKVSVIGTNDNYYESAPSDITIHCRNELDSAVVLSGNNICGISANVSLSEIESGSDCDKTITRTWNFTLPNQTPHTEIQQVRIVKNIPPIFQAPDPQTIDCDAYNSTTLFGTEPVVNTYCDLTYTLDYSDNGNLNVACLNGVKIERTWIATDACGNSTTDIQVITLRDNRGPNIESIGPDVNIECDHDFPPANYTEISFTDDCNSLYYDYDHSDIKVSMSPFQECVNNYIVTRTYYVFDACGNSSSMSKQIISEDTKIPEYINFPDDIVTDCLIPNPEAVIISYDECDSLVNNSFSVSDRYLIQTSCLTSIERFYTISDKCGNSYERMQRIKVEDKTPPEFFGNLSDDSFKCTGDIPSPTELGIVAEDECDEMVNFTVNETSQSYICDDKLTIKRTYTSTDQCNNTTTVDQYFYIDNDIKPAIISIFPDTYVEFGNQVPSLDINDVEASYGCATQNNYSDPELGLDISINEDSIPGRCINHYTLMRHIRITDECGNYIDTLQSVEIDDRLQPYIEISPDDIFVECYDDYRINYNINQYSVTDAAIITSSFQENLNYSNCSNDFQKTYTTIFSDGCNEESHSYNVTVYNPNPPTINDMDNLDFTCRSEVPINNSYDVVAQAYCSSGSVSISKFGSDDVIYDNCENKFSFIRTFIATDNCGLSSTVQQTITVNDDVEPIAATPPPNQTIYGCGDDYLLNGIVPDLTGYSDNCGGVVVTKSKNLVRGTGCSSDPMIIENVWVFTDACGNSSTVSQKLTFIDIEAPDFDIPNDTIISCERDIPGLITILASDNCGLNGVNISTPQTNDLGGIGNLASPKFFERIYTASDGCNVTTKTQIISVIDSIPPRITSGTIQNNIIQECSTLPQIPIVTAVDDESCYPISTDFNEYSNGRTGCQGDHLIFTRVWTFTDAVGNSSSVTQTIRIDDNTPPLMVFTSRPDANVIVNCKDLIPTTDNLGANAIDNCDGNLSVTLTKNDSNKIGCPNDPRQIYRTWTAIDNCGNVGIYDQLVTVIDDVAPTFTVPDDLDLDCDLTIPGPVSLGSLNVQDCNSYNYSYIDNFVRGSGSNALDPLIKERVYTVVDVCNNATSEIQMLSLVDYNPGTISGGEGIECSGVARNLTAQGGMYYLWSNGRSNQTTTYNPSSTTNAYVSITNANGCVTSATQILEVYSSQNIEVACDPYGCTVDPFVPGAYYRWYDGSNIVLEGINQTFLSNPFINGHLDATINGNCTISTNISGYSCTPPEISYRVSAVDTLCVIRAYCTSSNLREEVSTNRDISIPGWPICTAACEPYDITFIVDGVHINNGSCELTCDDYDWVGKTVNIKICQTTNPQCCSQIQVSY